MPSGSVVVVVVPPPPLLPCPPLFPGATVVVVTTELVEDVGSPTGAVVVVTATEEVVVSQGRCELCPLTMHGSAGAAVTSSGTLTLLIATNRRPATIACKRIRQSIRCLCTFGD